MKRIYFVLLCISIAILIYSRFDVWQTYQETKRESLAPVSKPKAIAQNAFGPCKDMRGQTQDAPEVAGLEPRVLIFSSDCRWLVSGNENGSIQVFDRESGRLIGENPGHSLRVARLAISPDDKYIFSSGQASGEVFVLALPSAQKIATIRSDDQAEQSLAFDLRRSLLITGGSQFLKGWSIKPDAAGRLSGIDQPVFSVRVKRVVTSLAVSADGRYIAAGQTGAIQLWEYSNDNSSQVNEIASRDLHELSDWVMGVAFSEDGKVIATGARDKKVEVWRVPTLEPVPQAAADPAKWDLFTDPWSFTAAPVRDYTGADKLSLVFKLHESTADRVYAAWAGRTIQHVTAQRGAVHAVGNSGGISFFDISSRNSQEPTMSIPSGTADASMIMLNYVTVPAPSLLVVKRGTAEISFIDLQNLKEVRKVESVTGPVSLQGTADGKLVAYSNAAEVGFIDLKTGVIRKLARPMWGKDQQLINLQIALSIDGAGIAAVFGEKLVVIRPDLHVTEVMNLPLMAVSFIAPLRTQNAYLVVGHDNSAMVGNGGVKVILPISLPIRTSFGNAVVISPDEQSIFVKHEGRICHYSLSANTSCSTVTASENDSNGVFDTDGKILAEGGNKKILRILNVTNGEEMFKMEGHVAEIRYVKLLGTKILSVDATGEVRVWAASDGRLVAKARL